MQVDFGSSRVGGRLRVVNIMPTIHRVSAHSRPSAENPSSRLRFLRNDDRANIGTTGTSARVTGGGATLRVQAIRARAGIPVCGALGFCAYIVVADAILLQELAVVAATGEAAQQCECQPRQ